DADHVGLEKAWNIVLAWWHCRRHQTRQPHLDQRRTRVCLCGQSTDVGRVDSMGVIGLPLLTGSEEGRGPLYDLTHVPFEGRMAPASVGPQGDKIPVFAETAVPKAVPLAALRLGDRVIATIPGEMTVEMG